MPAANADEALIAATTTAVRAASHLKEVCRHLTGEEPLCLHTPMRRAPSPAPQCGTEPDLSDVRGQFQAKRALLIAAAGVAQAPIEGIYPRVIDDEAFERVQTLIVGRKKRRILAAPRSRVWLPGSPAARNAAAR